MHCPSVLQISKCTGTDIPHLYTLNKIPLFNCKMLLSICSCFMEHANLSCSFFFSIPSSPHLYLFNVLLSTCGSVPSTENHVQQNRLFLKLCHYFLYFKIINQLLYIDIDFQTSSFNLSFPWLIVVIMCGFMVVFFFFL